MVDWLTTTDYDAARFVIQRGVALVYLIAFVNVRNQFRPLLGEHGLLAVPAFTTRVPFRAAPSLFHWRYSDRLLSAVAWIGIGISAIALLGGFDRIPTLCAIVGWLVLWALYLSVVNVGQRFYSFGWESLLLEAGLAAALLGNARVGTPILAIFVVRWLLFRVEFGAGMIKMRGDPCWRDLTCLDHHHETQPMPNPLSRRFHLLPTALHRVETAANHVAQLAAPWMLLLPQPFAGIGAATMIATQAYLMLSGNYAWLNLLTLLLGFAAIPDSWFAALGATIDDPTSTSATFDALVVVCTLGILGLSWQPLRNLFSSGQRMNTSYDALHLVNSYGAFGSVTRERREVIVEGTLDGETWQPYEFRAKPGDSTRRPGQFAPYHLRLDWLMWFLALSPGYGAGWFERFVERLLAADAPTLALLARDPFDGAPPTMVRARLVEYRFATRTERRQTGQHWVTGSSRTLLAPRRP